jgi:hypothetical protein
MRVGSKLTFDARGTPQLMEVTAWQPNQELGLQSQQGGIVVDYSYSLSPSPDGTRVQLSARCSAQSGVWRLFVPIVSWMMERTDRKQLQALARLVEATTGGARTDQAAAGPAGRSGDQGGKRRGGRKHQGDRPKRSR